MIFLPNKHKRDNQYTNLYSITIFSIVLFFIWMIINALIIFKQFTIVQVLSVGILFFLLLLVLIWLFMKSFFHDKLILNNYTIISAFFLSSFLLLLANNVNPMFSSYTPTYPLIETELKLGWNIDTVFHVSIIQSILNFGYPSIGQHGTLPMVYHVLSHYIDAGLIFLTGLEPYDSYGLFFHFKIFIILSIILIFIFIITKELIPFLYIMSIIIFMPIILGTWHLIGSHGLSYTSMLIILGSIWIFHILYIKDKNSTYDLFFLLLFVVFISIGKISSGFMYAIFIGFYLVLKQPKDIKVYLLGSIWIMFFFIYKNTMIDTEVSNIYILPSLHNVLQFLTDGSFTYFKMPKPIYASLAFLALIFFLFKTKNIRRLFLASLFSFLILMLITLIIPMNSNSDIFYFQYALSIILDLFVLQALFSNISLKIKQHNISLKETIIIIIMFMIWIYFHYVTEVHFRKHTLPEKTLDQITTLLHGERRPLYSFRENLFEYLEERNLTKNDVVLFIPKEIYEEEINVFKGRKYARGMLIYAITGVPLIHGIVALGNTYGYADYNKSAEWVNKNNFNKEVICTQNLSKYIILTKKFNPPNFKLYRCK